MRKLLERAILGIEAELLNLTAEAVKVWDGENDGEPKVKFSVALTLQREGEQSQSIKCKVKAGISTRVESEGETRIDDPDADQQKFAFDPADPAAPAKPANVVEIAALPAGPTTLLLNDRENAQEGGEDAA